MRRERIRHRQVGTGEVVPARQQPGQSRVVLLRQQRAGDVDDPAARPDQPRGARSSTAACSATRVARLPGLRAPLGVGVAPPGAVPVQGASTSTRSACPSRSASHVGTAAAAAGRAHLAAAAPARRRRSWIGASRRGSPSLATRRPAVLIIAASARVLPPPPAQRVDHRLARPGARQQGGELRALVLDLEPAVEEFRLDMQGGAAAVVADRHPQAVRPRAASPRRRDAAGPPAPRRGRSSGR